MITLEEVKKTVEDVYNETALEPILDISTKSRKRPIPDLRFTYFALCKALKEDLKNPSQEKIAEVVKRDHATYLHGVKQFDNFKNSKDFIGTDLFEKCMPILSENPTKGLSIEAERQQIIAHFRVKSIEMSNMYRVTINSLQEKLCNYRTNPFLDEIASLDEDDIKDLEVKLDAFFKVKKSLKIAS